MGRTKQRTKKNKHEFRLSLTRGKTEPKLTEEERMSEIVRIKGKIQKVERIENETDKEYFERVTKRKWQVYNYTPNSIDEAIYDNNLYREYIEIDNSIYKFLEYKEVDLYSSFININKEEDIYTFDTCFYDGGTCLEEMLREAIKGEEEE